jgi:mono/diheme cytochrome c family protein
VTQARQVRRVKALIAALLVASGTADASELTAGNQQAEGLRAFTHRCGMCHREGGTGTYILARRLGAQMSLLEKRIDLKPDYIRFVVRSGLVNMPRLSRVEVPDPDLNAIAAYLTTPRP